MASRNCAADKEKDAVIAEQQKEILGQQKKMDDLDARLTAIEQWVGSLNAVASPPPHASLNPELQNPHDHETY